MQVKCEARAESNLFELCRAEAFTRRCNLFASAKLQHVFGPEKASNLVVEDPVEGFGYLLKILLKIPLFAAP